jgi:FAD:protein FMN transferase
MKETRIIMGMPVGIEIVDKNVKASDIEDVFDYFRMIDEKFSTFKESSEVSLINKGLIKEAEYSELMKEVLRLTDETKEITNGYFNVYHDGRFDPSGIVKGWAINGACGILKEKGYKNFFVDAGGDISAIGKNKNGEKWRVGIRNPFNTKESVKVVELSDMAIATSGNYERGEHIYDPTGNKPASAGKQDEIVSVTVIGPNIYEADRFATAAFVMGKLGVVFIEKMDNLEAYVIDKNGVAVFTSGFEKYVYS